MAFSNIVNLKRWKDAHLLLSAQLDLFVKRHYKHYKTLSFTYYATVKDEGSEVKKSDYYEQKVATGLFYGLRNEFAIFSYAKPKPNFGLRDYRFMSLPMRVLYYAVGLYVVNLTQEFLDEYYKKRNRIFSSYGAEIRYIGENLQLRNSNLLFYDDYKKFRRTLKSFAVVKQDRLVLKIDIQNYYDNLSIPKLLQLLGKFVKQSEQQRFAFSVDTQSELRTFFEFVSRGRPGIPQSDNDPISSFLGHLYLVFGDLMIDDELSKLTSLKSHQIIRYMDDIYIVVDFKSGLSQADQHLVMIQLLERIADSFYSSLGLRLNDKTRLFWLDSQKEIDILLQGLKRISPRARFYFPGENKPTEKEEELQEIVDKLLNSLESLTLVPSDEGRIEPKFDEEALKDVFDKTVSEFLSKPESLTRLEKIIKGIDWELVKIAPQELTILILKSQSNLHEYAEYLKKKANLTTRDREMITTLLTHHTDEEEFFLSKLRDDDIMAGIAKVISTAQVISDDAGYFGLSQNQINTMTKFPIALEQLKLRIISEDLERYSVALNHLVNEFQTVCRILDGVKIGSNFDANGVIRFLQTQNVEHDLCLGIRNLFDRRNLNKVSHASDKHDQPSWEVSSQEYSEYRNIVGQCMRKIVQPVLNS